MIAPQKSSLIGQPLGKYRISREIGHSSVGNIYEILQDSIGYRAAIKVLGAELARDPNHQQYISRFVDEARAVNFIQHAGVVKIFDLGELADGSLYIMMEFLDGQTLAERQAVQPDQRIPLSDALRITRQVASVMTHVHNKGVLHRDLKPDNIVLVADAEAPGGERIKLIDFGLAKFLDSPERRTSIGMALGTPTYMAPEQCLGSDTLNGRADVYSLGVILYEMLAGRPPYSGSQQEVMQGHVRGSLPPLGALAPGLPDTVLRLVEDMLAKTITERPDMGQIEARVAKLEASLKAAQGSQPIRTAGGLGRRLGMGIAVGLLLALVGGIGLWLGMKPTIRHAVCAPPPVAHSDAAALPSAAFPKTQVNSAPDSKTAGDTTPATANALPSDRESGSRHHHPPMHKAKP